MMLKRYEFWDHDRILHPKWIEDDVVVYKIKKIIRHEKNY
jgi:hypothetical protein